MVVPDSETPRTYDRLDLHLDLVHGKVVVRMPDDTLYEPDPDLTGVKGLPLSMLLKLLRRPGVLLTPHEIGSMPTDHPLGHFEEPGLSVQQSR